MRWSSARRTSSGSCLRPSDRAVPSMSRRDGWRAPSATTPCSPCSAAAAWPTSGAGWSACGPRAARWSRARADEPRGAAASRPHRPSRRAGGCRGRVPGGLLDERQDQNWRGHADFLYRVERPSTPGHGLRAGRLQARPPGPSARCCRLCAYADQLTRVQGVSGAGRVVGGGRVLTGRRCRRRPRVPRGARALPRRAAAGA